MVRITLKKNEVVWVDLAHNCENYVGVMPSPDGLRSCWICQHFWNWESLEWHCEFVDKERKRKLLMVSRFQGQQTLNMPKPIL